MSLLRCHRHRIALGLVVGAYLVLAAVYNAASPVFEAPDEIWHYMYVRHLAEGGGLPRDEGRDQGLLVQQEAAQPPLYYVVAAALTFWAPRGDLAAIAQKNVAGSQGDAGSDGNKNMFLHGPEERFPWSGEILTVHLVRLTTTLWGLLTVLLTYGIGQSVFSSAWQSLAAAAVVAYNPEFLFMSSAVNNDVAVAAACALLLWVAIKVSQGKIVGKACVALGATAGAVILTKPIAAGAVLLVVLSLALRARRKRLSIARFALGVGEALLTAAIVCGGWFVYNERTYGSILPLQTFLSRPNLFETLPTVSEFVADLGSLRLSYWAVFGWFSILAPPWFYRYVGSLELLAIFGIGVAALRGWIPRGRPLAGDGAGVAMAAAQVLLVAVGLFVYRLIVLAFQGRLLLGAASGVGILLVFGWAAIGGRRLGPILALALSLSFVVTAALMPSRVIQPSYRAAPTIEVETAHPALPTAVRFGDDIRLLGTDTDPPLGTRLRPGQVFSLRLYFQPIKVPSVNNVLFIKLVDVRGRSIDEIDTHPGHGNLPTGLWRPPSVVVDEYRFQIPLETAGPAVYRLFIGFFPLETMENLAVWAVDGRKLGTSYQVGTYVVSGLVDLTRSNGPNRFQEDGRDVISVVDSHIAEVSVRPGATLEGKLLFGSVDTVARNYTVFVHLDSNVGLVSQDDSEPARGAFPTTNWSRGDLVSHPWQMKIPPNVAAGDYVVSAGFYDVLTGQRLRTNSGNSVVLGTVRIE